MPGAARPTNCRSRCRAGSPAARTVLFCRSPAAGRSSPLPSPGQPSNPGRVRIPPSAMPPMSEAAGATQPNTAAPVQPARPGIASQRHRSGAATRYQRNQLKRSLPAAFLILATACVILIDAVVVVVPQAMADPKPSAPSSAGTVVAAASATARGCANTAAAGRPRHSGSAPCCLAPN